MGTSKQKKRGIANSPEHAERAAELARCMDAMQAVANSHGVKSMLITVKDEEGLAAHAINHIAWDDAFRLGTNLIKEICDEAAGEMLQHNAPTTVVQFFITLKKKAEELHDSFGKGVEEMMESLRSKVEGD